MPKLAFLGFSIFLGSGQISFLARAIVLEASRLPWHQTGTTVGARGWGLFSLVVNQVLPGLPLYHLTGNWPRPLFVIIIIACSRRPGFKKLLEKTSLPSWGLSVWTVAVWNRMRTRTERGWRRNMFLRLFSSLYWCDTLGSFIFISKSPLIFLKELKWVNVISP